MIEKKPADEWAIERAAQIWCKPQHEHKVMDPDMAMSIAEALAQARAEALEEAAKVVESLLPNDFYGAPVAWTCITSAAASLRALAKEEKP